MVPRTEAVYLDDATLRTLTTEVQSSQSIPSLSEEEKGLAKNVPVEYDAITMHRTIFYAQGGGQPSDTGSLGPVDQDPTFEVSLVRKTPDGRFLHFGKFLDATSSFAAGQPVVQKVDDSKRNYHSRLHTAGHIVGLAMQLLMPDKKKVKANHFPREASMEYEGLLYNEHKPVIQEKVDELVRLDLPILISWLQGVMQAGNGEGAEEGSHGGRTRIASIGGLDHNPCGGTHVARTSLVGTIVIRKISRQKGISRVAYDISPGL
ncbi:Translation elongation/initiation factor/Ribosomal beta-barrel [Penicillium robsamsonii]|uniref:Translation elongation/initiation factor/Ribosomal beta-barrel n=1 Tax=Penicillium robsamsonii TaxID=1792511 RepID=UPI0025471588|nr:Translation elongation/initiation factor/Ribosomal beta-barrel [Penicillium robsamsonii]KAJ5834932.1 Translation elongation/initiation factor/Ribosomal beta-barrel [Penicillium robsamsonii]